MTNDNDSRNIEKKPKKKKISGIAGISLLIFLFDRLGDIIYDAILNSFIGKIFTSYTPLRKKLSSGICATAALKSGRVKKFFRKIRKELSGYIESCVSVSVANKFIFNCCSFPLQFYGNFGLFFGIYAIVVYFVKLFVPSIEAAEISHLFFAVTVTIISIPMLFSRTSLANSIKNSVVGRAMFKDCFGFSDEVFDNKNATAKGRGNFMLLLGLLAGVSTFFIHPGVIISVILLATLLILIAISPEIGVLISIISIPFLSFFEASTLALAVLVIITTFFYVIKVIRGKRTFNLEIVDLAVLIFGILILTSSFFSAGGDASSSAATVSFILLLGYFLVVNLMRTELWIKRCIISLVASASIVALIGVYEFIFGSANNNWLDQSFHSIIKLRVVSLFENPNILAMFLVIIFPFLIALSLQAKEKNTKFLSKILVAIFVVCVVFTWSRGAWIAALLSCLAFALIKNRKAFRVFGVAIFCVPVLSILLPDSIWSRFTSIANLSDSSTAYRIYTWKGTMNTVKETGIFGIGYGDASFQAVYPSYAYSGIEASPHSHSLLLQILVCMGIVGLVVFAIVIFLNFQKCFEFIKEYKYDSSTVYVIAAVSSAIAALTMGIFDYIWYNQRIFYLFWIVLAIGCACVRVGNYERKRRLELEDY